MLHSGRYRILTADDERSGHFDRISVCHRLLARFPGFRLGVVLALGLENGPSTAASRQLLRSGAARGIASLNGHDRREVPNIQYWREAYAKFGAKPSAYPCSAEALLQRAIKSGVDQLPAINTLVDIYNAVSLAYVLPIGGEDLDRIEGRCQLRIAGQADAVGNDANSTEAGSPDVGEVIWSDERGWTCRRWNWRQGKRTRLTESTRNAMFLVEGMASANHEPDLTAAIETLCAHIDQLLRPETLQAGWIL